MFYFFILHFYYTIFILIFQINTKKINLVDLTPRFTLVKNEYVIKKALSKIFFYKANTQPKKYGIKENKPQVLKLFLYYYNIYFSKFVNFSL